MVLQFCCCCCYLCSCMHVTIGQRVAEHRGKFQYNAGAFHFLIITVTTVQSAGQARVYALLRLKKARQLPVLQFFCRPGHWIERRYFCFEPRKKKSTAKRRMKEGEIEKGDCGPPAWKVFLWEFFGLHPSGTRKSHMPRRRKSNTLAGYTTRGGWSGSVSG